LIEVVWTSFAKVGIDSHSFVNSEDVVKNSKALEFLEYHVLIKRHVESIAGALNLLWGEEVVVEFSLDVESLGFDLGYDSVVHGKVPRERKERERERKGLDELKQG
jgi:hypothetical protein